MPGITTTCRYIKAAPWPHATGVAALGLALGLAFTAHGLWRGGETAEALPLGVWACGWLVVALFAGADGVSRHREYRRIRAMFRKYGFHERIVEPVARSRCQRDAVLLAADEAGCGQQVRDYFRCLGYRWYHVLPDPVVRNPLIFLNPRFLRRSFFPGKKFTDLSTDSSAAR